MKHRAIPSPQQLAELRTLPIFARFEDVELAQIARRLTDVEVPAGAVLVKEGQPGREAFIVASGTAVIQVGDQVIGNAGAGDLVGEMALLDGRPRAATVVSVTTMRLLVMDPSEFGRLLEDPRTARWIAASLSNRVREAAEHPV